MMTVADIKASFGVAHRNSFFLFVIGISSRSD